MSTLYLIRHGQASFGSSNYDQLSDIGYQQATWLGEHFADMGVAPSHIITGSLSRHAQTAKGLLDGLGLDTESETDERWNEFDFETIARAYLKDHPEEMPSEHSVKAFFGVLRRALKSWSDGCINAKLPESWSDFEHRIKGALDHSQSSTDAHDKQTIFVVSSGGAISMALKHLLGFNNDTLIDLNLQSRNTGFCECYFNSKQCYVTSFNSIPHLQTPNRKSHITSA